jgi:hypothetical protein
LIAASQDLYERVARLQGAMDTDAIVNDHPVRSQGPARQLLDRLESSL